MTRHWEVFPFGERTPRRIWEHVEKLPGWFACPAWAAPQQLNPIRADGELSVPSLVSLLWGDKLSPRHLRVDGYALAAHAERRNSAKHEAAARSILRLQHLLLSREADQDLLPAMIRHLVARCLTTGSGALECVTVTGRVAAPRTFDPLDALGPARLDDRLRALGFSCTGTWSFYRGPIEWTEGDPVEAADRDLGAAARSWEEYAPKHYAPLLQADQPQSTAPAWFFPRRLGGSLKQLGIGAACGEWGEWTPDLRPFASSGRRWNGVLETVHTLRVWRCFRRPGSPVDGRRALAFPAALRHALPAARFVEIGPISSLDGAWHDALKRIGMRKVGTLRLLSLAL